MNIAQLISPKYIKFCVSQSVNLSVCPLLFGGGHFHMHGKTNMFTNKRGETNIFRHVVVAIMKLTVRRRRM